MRRKLVYAAAGWRGNLGILAARVFRGQRTPALGYATCDRLTTMRNKLEASWSRLISTLWFVPTLIIIGSLALGMVMVQLSAIADNEVLARWPRLFGANAESSQAMLSAIAGSMITVAGVTFSITMVAVTQASSQYTPRILRHFMRDRWNGQRISNLAPAYQIC